MKNRKDINTIILFIATYALINIASGSYSPFISSYYQMNNISKLDIGLIACLGPISAIFIQPIWGKISDKTGKKKAVLVLLTIATALTMILYLLHYSLLWMALCALLFAGFSYALIPLYSAVIVANEDKTNVKFSTIRIGGSMGYAIMALLVGFIVENNIQFMFIISCFWYLVLLVVILISDSSYFDTKALPKAKQEKTKSKMFDTKEVYYVFALSLIDFVLLLLMNTYIGPKVIELGYNKSTVGLLSFVDAFSQVPILLMINRVSRKVNPVYLMFFGSFMAIIRLLLASSNSLFMIILSEVIVGFAFIPVSYPSIIYIAKHVLKGNESQAQTLLVVIQSGVAAIIANIFGGVIVQRYSINFGYVLMALISLVMLLLLFVAYKLYQKRNDMVK